MITPNDKLTEIALKYAAEHGLALGKWLGGGSDGDVWQSDRKTAIKTFQYERNFLIELACYQRLAQYKVREVLGLAVPRLVDFSRSHMVVEMDLVTPPYLIDFGKAYLDSAPEHSAETWQDYYDEQHEIWGDRFSTVQAIMYKLRTYGIIYRDASPRNIRFGALE